MESCNHQSSSSSFSSFVLELFNQVEDQDENEEKALYNCPFAKRAMVCLVALALNAEAKLQHLLREVLACTVCAAHLPFPPRPILRASSTARLLIVGQAPGTKVQATGIPWNDPSGDRLRLWLGLTRDQFYDESRIAIIPTGFCYPGKGASGDLPPRPECAPLWHPKLLATLPDIQLTLLIGSYAQAFYLQERAKDSLTETVQKWREYLPKFLPLPHPSPRNMRWFNMRWFKTHPWFEAEVVPELRKRVVEELNR